MKAVQIIPDIYWVGAVDWDVRHFHGHTYNTNRGTTYNAYLIIDKKITLVDAVYGPFAQDMIDAITGIIPLKKIDHIIVNHVEPDHSGSLPKLVQLCPQAKLFGSAKCKEGLEKHYHGNWDFNVVKTGDTLSLGKRTVQFIEAPMIHWPDSMFSYIPEEALLMPNDAFGQHYATKERFDDEVDASILMEEAEKYYANILWPLGTVIAKKLEDVKKLNLPIKMIAPSHGIIWRGNPGKIVEAYQVWTKNTSKKKAVVLYETMWGSTEKIAKRIADGIRDGGVPVKLFDVVKADKTEIIYEMFESRGYCIGSSTHDNDMLPNIAGFMHLLKGLRPKNRIAGVFGSYGWAGGAVKGLEQVLKETGISIVQEPLTVQYVPGIDDDVKCYEYGRAFAKKIKED